MFNRNCPQCGKEVSYKRKDALDKAIRENRHCQSCNMKLIWQEKPLTIKGTKRINKTFLKKDEFISRANNIHNFFYDYSKILYLSYRDKIEIVCQLHGSFWQTPSNHVNNKQGCPKCGKTAPVSHQEFLDRAYKVHRKTYDYNLVKFSKIIDKIIIVCKIHGEFLQEARSHCYGQGCPSCSKIISRMEIKWLDMIGIPNDINHRHVRLNINGNNIVVDGFDPITNTIYEFYGDIFHGNPNLYNRNQISPISKVSYGYLYDQTIERENKIINAGYKLISIWENNFKEIKDAVE